MRGVLDTHSVFALRPALLPAKRDIADRLVCGVVGSAVLREDEKPKGRRVRLVYGARGGAMPEMSRARLELIKDIMTNGATNYETELLAALEQAWAERDAALEELERRKHPPVVWAKPTPIPWEEPC